MSYAEVFAASWLIAAGVAWALTRAATDDRPCSRWYHRRLRKQGDRLRCPRCGELIQVVAVQRMTP